MELRRLGDICLKYDVLVLSDEIHFDMVLPGHRHIVYATLGEAYAQRSVTFSAPSKTFNLAGLKTSYVIIPEEGIRERFKEHMRKISAGSPTILGFKACEIAYTKCLDWLDQVVALVDKTGVSLRIIVRGAFRRSDRIQWKARICSGSTVAPCN